MMPEKEVNLRDWYAGLAMQAIISTRHPFNHPDDCQEIAPLAFTMAEAMMGRRREITALDDAQPGR
jgi:hypothetical protein